MYFCNFVNKRNIILFSGNLIFLSCDIFLIIYLHNKLVTLGAIDEVPKTLALKLAFLIYFIYPFMVSGMSILFDKSINVPDIAGFSCIACGLLGYFLYLGIKYYKFYDEKRSPPFQNYPIFLLYSLVIVAFAYANLKYIDFIEFNSFGHICGLIIGLIIPFFIEGVFNKPNNKKIVSLFCIFLICSFFWIFIYGPTISL